MNKINELVFILDASGSMYDKAKDVIGGFNSIIDTQKEIEGEAYVTVVVFDDEVKIIVDRCNLKDVKAITPKEYKCSGTTALLDAIGMSINHIDKIHHYIRKEDVPSKTTFFITTDGLENASKEYDFKTIKKMISDYTKEKEWEFNFLAQNIDAASCGQELGIKAEYCANYSDDNEGIAKQFSDINACVSRKRTRD